MTAPLDPPASVSVVVPTCDRPEMLQQALASVRALEGHDLSLQVIVVDNCPTGSAEPVARSFGALYLPSATSGAAATRNAGLRAATNEFIAFLDDDDVWLAGHLRPQIAKLRASPELAGVIGQVVNCDETLTDRSYPWPAAMPDDGDLFAGFLGLCPQIGATVVRATVLDTVGYLDEALPSDEDWDWHLRLALQHPLGFVAEPCVLFRGRAAGVRDDLYWLRLALNRRVFWRYVRRAGSRRPAPHVILRRYLSHNGSYAARFLRAAAAHAAAGDSRKARRALLWALQASPLHAAKGLILHPRLCRALLV